MDTRQIRIFLGSPSDVEAEREAVKQVIDEVNKRKNTSNQVKLEVILSDNVVPFQTKDGRTVQESLNDKFQIDKCDLFVGIMWKSIGDSQPKSGTIAEYELAEKFFYKNGQPKIWFYFRNNQEDKGKSQELEEFKTAMKKKAFFKSYSDEKEFKNIFSDHVKSWLKEPENNTLLEMTEAQKTELIEKIAQEIAEKKMDLLGKELLFINPKKLKGDKQNGLKGVIKKIEKKLLDKFKYLSIDSSIKEDNSKLKSKIAEHLCDFLLKKKQLLETNPYKYGAGNILNLLIQLDLRKDFSYFNLSRVYIYEADLEKAILKGVDFSNADLKNSSFSEPLGCIHSIAFNADGTYFATGDAHGIIRVYNTESLETRIFNTERRNQIWSVAFGSNKEKFPQILAWGSEDGTVKVLNIDNINSDKSSINDITNKIIYESNEGRRILSVAFSPNGHLFAIGGDGDNAIKLIEINKNNSQKGILRANNVTCMTFIDEDSIACGTQYGKISLLSVARERTNKTKSEGHEGVVRCIAFNKKRRILATGGEDGNVKMFSSDNLDDQLPFNFPKVSQVRTLAFSEDGNNLAIGYIDNQSSEGQSEHKILLFNFNEETKTWERRSQLDNLNNNGHEHLIRSIAFCPDPKKRELLISGGDDRTVKLWDINTQECKHTLSGYANRIWSVAFSRDGKTFACGGEDNKIRLWNYHDRTHIPTQILSEHTDWVWSVAFSPKGDILASGSEDNKIFLWQLKKQQSEEQKWEYIQELKQHNKRVRCVAFNPDGDKLASAGNDNKVVLWNISNVGKPIIIKTTSHKARVLSLAFSPDGKYLASSNRDKTICLIDGHTGVVQNKNLGSNDEDHHTDQVHSIAFSPNSDLLVSGGFDQKLNLWEVPSGSRQLDWEGDQKILSVAFHPNGNIVASAGDNHFITLWDISKIHDGKPTELKTLKGHKRTVESIAFSPDGKNLISCSQDQTIKFWQIEGDINISIHTIELGKPYQGMNIFGFENLEAHQISALEELGASRNV